jgi:N-methylhydantoinase A
VTDANLVLGRLDPAGLLGGRMALDGAAARAAIARVAAPLGLSVEAAALGIVRIADEHMAAALRVISVQRGLDPRDFTLTSFGGAGGLSVCALAQALGVDRALVPVHAGVLSALGMLAAPAGRTLTRTRLGTLADLTDAELERALADLAADGIAGLEHEGQDPARLRVERALDLRYRGQSYTLDLPWTGAAATTRAFHARHQERYGHQLDLPVELVNLRVRVRAPAPSWQLPAVDRSHRPVGPIRNVRAYGCAGPVPVVAREALVGSAGQPGPAIVADPVATIWVAAGWTAAADAVGNLWLDRRATSPGL